MSLPSRLPAILQAVMQGQPRALSDSHYPRWHHAPVSGLMNDPNGFVEFAGRYHLFYQWNPLACDHKFKCWAHWSSADLLHWQHEPIALMPDEEYDRNGCYSGSAVDNHGTLTLCYTGNVKFDDGSRTAWQCLATENADGTFTKLGPVLPLPEGYTGHVRDPKVWQHEGRWYMVLGAQDRQKRGKVLLFSSANLREWTSREETRFLNTYPAVWMAGDFDYDRAAFKHGELHELDAGFEFYAPQTMQTSDGRRLLVGWMGVPDGEEMRQPTLANGWIHQMTCLRELEFADSKLYQRPLRELTALRGEAHGWPESILPLAPMEISLETARDAALSIDFGGALTLERDACGIRLARHSLASDETHYRYWRGEVRSLRIFIDQSSVEIFINDGEGVMSSRYFPAYPAQLTFTGSKPGAFCYWPLRTCMIE